MRGPAVQPFRRLARLEVVMWIAALVMWSLVLLVAGVAIVRR
jgi:hypothetical protein